MPFMLAGGDGKTVKTGRWIKCGGVPHNKLLTSILNLYRRHADHIRRPARRLRGPQGADGGPDLTTSRLPRSRNAIV